MNFQEISGNAYQIEDQDEQDYIRDRDGFAIKCDGYFTIAELEMKIITLRDANRFFKKDQK